MLTATSTAAVDYPTTAELNGLIDRAKRRGVRIDGPVDRPVAFDPAAGRVYHLTAMSCSCKFFMSVGECQHHALFIDQQQPRETPTLNRSILGEEILDACAFLKLFGPAHSSTTAAIARACNVATHLYPDLVATLKPMDPYHRLKHIADRLDAENARKSAKGAHMSFTLYVVDQLGRPTHQEPHEQEADAIAAYDAMVPTYRGSGLELCIYDDSTDELIRSTHPDYQPRPN